MIKNWNIENRFVNFLDNSLQNHNMGKDLKDNLYDLVLFLSVFLDYKYASFHLLYRFYEHDHP